jgi:hypothetical protein
VTEPDPAAANVASDQSFVGVQATVVHGDVNAYMVPPGATAEQRFEAGVRYLESKVPGRAWELIRTAVEDGYVTDRARFYWLLALVSGRTRNELSADEVGLLRNRRAHLRLGGGNEWADGVEVVHRLLDSAERRGTDVPVLLKELDEVGGLQSRLIQEHLGTFLRGPVRDALWTRTVEQARREQRDRQRESRVWKFFQPAPCPPRGRPVPPIAISPMVRAQTIAGVVVLAAAALHIGYVLAWTGRLSMLAVHALSLAAGYFGARDGVEWRVREERRRAKEAAFRTPARSRTGVRPDGFARKVDREVDRYFDRYVPQGTDRQVWRDGTRGLRNALRNELVDGFRESRVTVEQITWLIRHRVGDIKTRWMNGTLWNHRVELQTPWPVKAKAVLGVAVLACGGIWAVTVAMLARPQGTAVSAALMLAGGWFAVHGRFDRRLEEQRHADEESGSARTLEKDKAAFDRWRDKLADRPEDKEMAAWLECDRNVLLATALRHYRLSMSDVRAYAFIEAPAPSTGRARVKGGPWRYLEYRLRVFVLTADGVRQLEAGLDFRTGACEELQRTNFRYGAVAAVRVRRAGGERTLELALVDGQRIDVRLIGPEVLEDIQPEERSEEVSAVTLDAAGLRHTLHVLEGIAAEGERWFRREDRREDRRGRRSA